MDPLVNLWDVTWAVTQRVRSVSRPADGRCSDAISATIGCDAGSLCNHLRWPKKEVAALIRRTDRWPSSQTSTTACFFGRGHKGHVLASLRRITESPSRRTNESEMARVSPKGHGSIRRIDGHPKRVPTHFCPLVAD